MTAWLDSQQRGEAGEIHELYKDLQVNYKNDWPQMGATSYPKVEVSHRMD